MWLLGHRQNYGSRLSSSLSVQGVLMKKVSILSALTARAIFPAQAADMAVKAPYRPAPVVVDPWTGFYVGANLGYSWGDWRADSSQPVFDFERFSASPNVDGVVGGFQAGFNWRVAPQWLFGIEADIQATGERARQAWTHPGLPSTQPPADFVPRPGGPASLAHEWKFPWFGTVRLRAGYNPASNWLIYATGGLAYGRTEYSFDFSQPGAFPDPTTYALRHSSTDIGYAVGFGSEV